MKNFCLLQPTLHSLRIPFDSRVAKDLMDGKPGTSSRLLSQLRTIFKRMEFFSVPTSVKGPVALGEMVVTMLTPYYNPFGQLVF